MGSSSVIRRTIEWTSHRAFRSRRLAEFLFGIKFLPVDADHYYFDATAVALSRHLRRSLRPGQRVVDMGSGTAAVLGLYLWKHVGCYVLSVDTNPKMVRMSADSVRANGAPIRVIESDLFQKVDEVFDVVTFNPPYVPTAVGQRRNLGEATRSQWDGGPSGTTLIERFLAALAALKHPAEAHIGVNKRHVCTKAMVRCISRQSGLALQTIRNNHVLGIGVYVVRNQA